MCCQCLPEAEAGTTPPSEDDSLSSHAKKSLFETAQPVMTSGSDSEQTKMDDVSQDDSTSVV